MGWLKVAKRAHQDVGQVPPRGPWDSVQDVGIGVVNVSHRAGS